MHPKLEAKLQKTHQHLLAVEEFAKALPLFADEIIDNEYTMDEFASIKSWYKKTYFNWGINWYPNRPTNLPDEVDFDISGTVSVYVNCLSMFHDDLYQIVGRELRERMQTVACYWYDDLNSTWYFLPEQAEHGLDVLNQWYTDMKAKQSEMINDIKIKALKKQIEELESK